jgi:hypothetical protein
MASTRGADQAEASRADPEPATSGRAVRVLATIAVLALVGSYVAAQVDFLRRHQPGIAPLRYWLPQARNIWAPGLGLALVSAIVAFALHRWGRRK